jgi:FAD synthase
VETHVLQQTAAAYGDWIEVFFAEKLRDEVTFPSVAALRERVLTDREAAIAWDHCHEAPCIWPCSGGF